MRARLVAFGQGAAIALMCAAIIAVIVAWPYGTPGETPSTDGARTADTPTATTQVEPDALPPMYGPPSPAPPIYGPPSPPSRVPLLDPSRRFNAPVLSVTGEDVRPTEEPEAKGPAPWGWASLDLDRGIPFVQRRVERDTTQADQSGTRRTLFEKAAPDPPPVSVAYCLDPAMGVDDPRKLDAARFRIKAAAAELRSGDRFAVLLLDGQGTDLLGGWQSSAGTADPSVWSKLDAVVPTAQVAPTAGLARAMSMEGATHVVAILVGTGDWPPEEIERVRRLARSGAPKVIALAAMDAAESPLAAGLRDLAIGTNGAFARLRSGGATRPSAP